MLWQGCGFSLLPESVWHAQSIDCWAVPPHLVTADVCGNWANVDTKEWVNAFHWFAARWTAPRKACSWAHVGRRIVVIQHDSRQFLYTCTWSFLCRKPTSGVCSIDSLTTHSSWCGSMINYPPIATYISLAASTSSFVPHSHEAFSCNEVFCRSTLHAHCNAVWWHNK